MVPLICAATAWLFGPSLEAVQVVLCGFFAATNGLIGCLAWRYYRRLSVVAMSMTLTMFFYPSYPWFCHVFSEPIFAALLALFLLVWTATMRNGSLAGYFATGLLLAVSALCRPEMYAFPPILLVDVIRKHRFSRRSAAAMTLTAAGFLLLEVPWVARNWLVVGKPILSADNGTMNLFLATWYQEANWMGNPFHEPSRFPPAGQGFWQLPESERNRIFLEMAKRNVREAPLSVLMCVPRRFVMFFYQCRPRGWLPGPKSLVLGTAIYVLAWIGFRRSSPEQRRLLHRALCLIGLIGLVHVMLVSDFRFSQPVQPYFLLMASVGALSLLPRRLFSSSATEPGMIP
jgi:hypothetical protein